MITLTTNRLLMREVEANDLPALLPVYLSNPEQVMANEGSQGEPGHYELAIFQRDWWLASLTPGRHMLGVYLLGTGIPIGLADYLEDNPDDGQPWLGQLITHADHQRKGYGAEAFCGLAAYFRAEYEWPTVRAGLARQNATAQAFLLRLGFRIVTPASPPADAQEDAHRRFVTLEYDLRD
ncbi:MAG TPA: GNAT family N-acetyltransferase [Ktedonobacterales bacterium]|nr:GNAT family N-acetyltransferase [Ktedonobacterales bacterium]